MIKSIVSIFLIFSLLIFVKSQEQFQYGVTSGDTNFNSTILWTRIENIPVSPLSLFLQLSNNEANLENSTNVLTLEIDLNNNDTLRNDNTIHFRVQFDQYPNLFGTNPSTSYFYRFIEASNISGNLNITSNSRNGKFLIPPLLQNQNRDITIVFTGDSDGATDPENGNPYYNNFEVLESIVRDVGEVDLFFYIGDTIYADSEADVQKFGREEAYFPEDFSYLYKRNRNFTNLANLLASTTTFAIWDDHEVKNDWTTEPINTTLFENARESFTSFWPINEGFGFPIEYSPSNFDWEEECFGVPFYRHIQWSNDIDIFVLDERSCRNGNMKFVVDKCKLDDNYVETELNQGPSLNLFPTTPESIRDDLFGPTNEILEIIGEFFDVDDVDFSQPPSQECIDAIYATNRTILGPTQKSIFLNQLRNSTARYKLIVNEVPIQELLVYPYDRWEGYPHERQEILSFIQDNNIENVIFLTTDIHMTVINPVFVDSFSSNSNHSSLGAAMEVVTGPIAMQSPLGVIRFNAPDFIIPIVRPLMEELAETLVEKIRPSICTNIDTDSYAVVKFFNSTGELEITVRDSDGNIVEDDEDDDKKCQFRLPNANLYLDNSASSFFNLSIAFYFIFISFIIYLL